MKILSNIQKTLVLFALLAMSTISMAQHPGGRNQNGPRPIPDAAQIEKMIERLDKQLELSDEQSTNIKAVYVAHFEEMEAKTKDGRPSRDEMEALRAEFETEVKAHLTDEQQAAYDKMRQERGQNNKRKRNN